MVAGLVVDISIHGVLLAIPFIYLVVMVMEMLRKVIAKPFSYVDINDCRLFE